MYGFSHPAVIAALIFIISSVITRCILTFWALVCAHITVSEALWGSISGVLSDLIPASYIFIVLSIVCLLVPRRIQQFMARIRLTRILWVVMVTLILMLAIGEILFWEEFGSRYNFIAIDYLIYTHEVMHNILESYPVGWMVSAIVLCAWGIVVYVDYVVHHISRRTSIISYAMIGALAVLLVTVDALSIQQRYNINVSKSYANRYAQELSYNGPYQLCAAFIQNSLDFMTNYTSMPLLPSVDIVRHDLGISGAWDGKSDPIARFINAPGDMRKLNVVVIMVESLSQVFLDTPYNGVDLTPYLHKIMPESIYFTNHYATGTRTVRGLEALSLSVPPTPGSSIVRRPQHDNLYSLGNTLNDFGYKSVFLYGGKGYFDNMNAFFSHNGYRIVDQNTIPQEKVHFQNAWGVADEILFDQALEEASAYHKTDTPFFLHIMTTSNHRPYTFPLHKEVTLGEGSRESAVQYTDFAIGQFIEKARSQPWFNDTIFVITADHCASSAGKSIIDVATYHTPWIIYAPKWIKPMRIEERSSQIDIAPTVLGLLHASYDNHFFGMDKILHRQDSIVSLGTYQNLGLWIKDDLVVLSPQSKVECSHYDGSWQKGVCTKQHVDEAVAWYEVASYRFTSGLMQRSTP